MRKYGFTLAEVLVTLGIIGVVAALTVPSLMQNAQKRVLVTSLRKVHSELSQATQLAMEDKHATTWSDANVSASDMFDKYLKTNSTSNTSISGSFSNVSGGSSTFSSSYCRTLKDGAFVCLPNSGTGDVFVDVNGTAQGPNVGGRDRFELYLNNSGDIVGYNGYANVTGAYGHSSSGVTFENAFSRIVNDGWEMNYD